MVSTDLHLDPPCEGKKKRTYQAQPKVDQSTPALVRGFVLLGTSAALGEILSLTATPMILFFFWFFFSDFIFYFPFYLPFFIFLFIFISWQNQY